jgi:hypothetical protein
VAEQLTARQEEIVGRKSNQSFDRSPPAHPATEAWQSVGHWDVGQWWCLSEQFISELKIGRNHPSHPVCDKIADRIQSNQWLARSVLVEELGPKAVAIRPAPAENYCAEADHGRLCARRLLSHLALELLGFGI